MNIKTILLFISLAFLITVALLTKIHQVPTVYATHECPEGYGRATTGAGAVCTRPKPPDCTSSEFNLPLLPGFCAVSFLPHPPADFPRLPTSQVETERPGVFTPEGLITQIVSKILPIVLGLGGFATVIIIVISGIQFVTSSGNPEAAAAARGRLMMALVGFVIIILAFAITQIIDNIFLGGSGVL